jgi:uncharacterized membrane protein
MPSEPTLHPQADYEATPLTRAEYLQAVIHFYRGEIQRVTTWRTRLDQTTNWAVLTTAAVLSFTFNSPERSQHMVLLGSLLVLVLLGIEARRFRFYDVWRARLRKLEENFYAPILRRAPQSPEPDWGSLVAADLVHPHYKITYFQAFRQRLLRNYVYIFLILLLAWFIKLWDPLHPESPSIRWQDLPDRMRTGPIPGDLMAGLVAAFYAFLFGCCIFERVARGSSKDWELLQPLDAIDQ